MEIKTNNTTYGPTPSPPPGCGTTHTSINVAEIVSLIMAEEAIPPNYPYIIITDSKIAFDHAHKIHQQHSITAHQYIRQIIPSISHTLSLRLQHTYHRRTNDTTPNNTPNHIQEIHRDILYQIRNLPTHPTKWNPDRHINETNQGIHIKISSLQLSPRGNPKPNQHPHPCYALTHANHWADRIAAIPLTKHTKDNCIPQYQHPTEIIKTPLLSQTYGFTHNGQYIDRDITTFIKDQYQQQLLNSLSL